MAIKKFDISKQQLVKLYINQKLSAPKIAERFGVSKTTILNRLNDYNIDRRGYSDSHANLIVKQILDDHENEIVDMYVNQKKSSIEIANHFKCSDATILDRLKKLKIPRRSNSEAHKCKPSPRKMDISKETLIDLYIHKKMDTYAIGELLGCSKTTILNKMKEYGIKPRTRSESRKHPVPERKFVIDEKTLIDLYINQKLSARAIGEKLGCSEDVVRSRLKDHNIKIRSLSEANKNNGNKIPIEKEELQRLYHDERLSARQIAAKLNRSCSWVMNRFREHGIETRSISEANSGEYNPSYNGGTGYLPYCHKFNNKFKEKIRARDNRTCQLCGKTEKEELKDLNRRLSIHHCHYDKDNCRPDVITLCTRCNLKVNYHRDLWEQHFVYLLAERGLLRVQQSELPQQTLEQSTASSL